MAPSAAENDAAPQASWEGLVDLDAWLLKSKDLSPALLGGVKGKLVAGLAPQVAGTYADSRGLVPNDIPTWGMERKQSIDELVAFPREGPVSKQWSDSTASTISSTSALQPPDMAVAPKTTSSKMSRPARRAFKTKMCGFFILGSCRKKDQCGFAHHEDELRAPYVRQAAAAPHPRAEMDKGPDLEHPLSSFMMEPRKVPLPLVAFDLVGESWHMHRESL